MQHLMLIYILRTEFYELIRFRRANVSYWKLLIGSYWKLYN
jgi:hypothetical protein